MRKTKPKKQEPFVPTPGLGLVKDLPPEKLPAKFVEKYAGKYAPCVLLPSGTLLRTSPIFDTPEEAQSYIDWKLSDWNMRSKHTLVVGFLCRKERLWITRPTEAQEPVPEAPKPPEPEPAPGGCEICHLPADKCTCFS